MSAGRSRPLFVALVLGIVAALVLGLGAVGAQDEESGIVPLFGDGKLRVQGSGFKAGEVVTLTVTTAAGTETFTVTAGDDGKIDVDTGIMLEPGSSVELNAVGDQGTGFAAITAAPGMLPEGEASAGETDALPKSGAPIGVIGLTIAGLGLVGGGAVLARRRARVG